MLTTSTKKAYSMSVKAKSLTRVSILKYKSAQALYRSVFFYAQKPSYGGLCIGSTGHRFSCTVMLTLHSLPPSYLALTVVVLRIYKRTPPCLLLFYIFYSEYAFHCLYANLTKLNAACQLLKKSWGWIMDKATQEQIATLRKEAEQLRQSGLDCAAKASDMFNTASAIYSRVQALQSQAKIIPFPTRKSRYEGFEGAY